MFDVRTFPLFKRIIVDFKQETSRLRHFKEIIIVTKNQNDFHTHFFNFLQFFFILTQESIFNLFIINVPLELRYCKHTIGYMLK